MYDNKRTLILFTIKLGFGNESRCFDELGCFPMEHPWTSNLRPFPQPMTPEEIDLKIYSFTRCALFYFINLSKNQ